MDPHAKEREKLRAIQAVFESAVENNTIEDIKPHLATDFSFVSFTDSAFSDFESFKKQWEITRSEMVGSGSFTTQLNPNKTIFIDDIALATGNSDNVMIDKKNNNFKFTSNWTVVFKQIDNEWKIVRAHNSLDPFSNPILKHEVKRLIIKYGIFSLISGALLCFLVMLLTQA